MVNEVRWLSPLWLSIYPETVCVVMDSRLISVCEFLARTVSCRVTLPPQAGNHQAGLPDILPDRDTGWLWDLHASEGLCEDRVSAVFPIVLHTVDIVKWYW